jgi:prephenate dehydratase
MLNAVVSIQGQPGSFHHIVARTLFGPDTSCLYRDTFREVFQDVANGHAGTAVLAIENSIAGSLIYNYDLLAQYRIPVKGEFTLRIAQHLIAHPGVALDAITEVWSHPMAIEQCRAFLEPLRLTLLEKPDTAGSVRELKESGRRDVAAISSAASAELYGMSVLRADIETDPHNYTRFLVLTHQDLPPALNRVEKKTSLHFSVADAPGSLARVLAVLDAFTVNMSKIESRPKVGSAWKYDFFCDITADIRSVDGLFDALAGATERLHVLGVYGDLST